MKKRKLKQAMVAGMMAGVVLLAPLSAKAARYYGTDNSRYQAGVRNMTGSDTLTIPTLPRPTSLPLPGLTHITISGIKPVPIKMPLALC